MNSSILHTISEYAKNNNVSINGIFYNFESLFPKAFYETVINHLKTAYPEYRDIITIKDFYIGFDRNKNAYFEFLGSNEKTRVIVLADYIRYDCIFPASLKIKENLFLSDIKKLDEQKKNEILDKLPDEFKRRFTKDDPIDNFFSNLTSNIILYMDYLENEKKKSYDLLDKEIINSKEVEKIYFIEGNSSTNSTRITTNTPRMQTERKNEEISFEERKSILDSYSAEETFEARSSNTNSIYYVKVFKTKEKCKLIMEPIEGNKYTKVVYLNQEKLASGEIKKIVIDYLQLNRNETTNTNEITRHSHTTIDEYKKLLEYLITEKNRGISSTTKIRIDEANNLKR